MVRSVLESLTDEELAADVTRIEPGWPQMENFPVKECLRIGQRGVAAPALCRA
jgi:hypothetical protein